MITCIKVQFKRYTTELLACVDSRRWLYSKGHATNASAEYSKRRAKCQYRQSFIFSVKVLLFILHEYIAYGSVILQRKG
jgi:hypothetical protein